MVDQAQHIIVADDDDDYRFIFEQALQESGFEARLLFASTGLEAIALLDSIFPLPIVLFLDINMPLMDGFTALAEIRQKEAYKNLPIVIFSTTEEPCSVQKAYKLGATRFLRKPEHYNDYIKILRTMLKSNNS